MLNRNRRLIKSGGVAKRLMNRGHVVADVAPQRDDPTRSVYIFFRDRWLDQDVDEIMQKVSDDKSALAERLTALNMGEKQYRRMIFEDFLRAGVFVA